MPFMKSCEDCNLKAEYEIALPSLQNSNALAQKIAQNNALSWRWSYVRDT